MKPRRRPARRRAPFAASRDPAQPRAGARMHAFAERGCRERDWDSRAERIALDIPAVCPPDGHPAVLHLAISSGGAPLVPGPMATARFLPSGARRAVVLGVSRKSSDGSRHAVGHGDRGLRRGFALQEAPQPAVARSAAAEGRDDPHGAGMEPPPQAAVRSPVLSDGSRTPARSSGTARAFPCRRLRAAPASGQARPASRVMSGTRPGPARSPPAQSRRSGRCRNWSGAASRSRWSPPRSGCPS